MAIDYYQLLGVSRDVSPKDLKAAFRKKALENHPDVINHLPDAERRKREELMYQVNEAYGTLSVPQKRREYDKGDVPMATTRDPEGPKVTNTRRANMSYESLFSSLFGKGGVFGDIEGLNGFFGYTQPNRESIVMMPENDWGLLVALKKAYEAKVDGKWRVKKTEEDERRWMPEEIYSVKRDGGRVLVFRRIMDWRSEWDRDKGIKVRKTNSFETEEEMKPDTFVGEYYFDGEGRNRLSESYNIPFNFESYLDALKGIARKLASKEKDKDDKYDVSQELTVINQYGVYGSRNTKVEGWSVWKDDLSREWVRKVPLDSFWKRMTKAEGRVVQVEGAPRNKESLG